MPKLTSAPTVESFARAFRAELETAVKDVAGNDGRLSRAEAEKLVASGVPYGDNAKNYLDRTGQKSVSVNKLIGRAEAYAYANGAKVAGANKRISLIEARMLPQDLQADWAALRGLAPATPAAGAALSADVRAKLDGVMNARWVSVSDVGDALADALKNLSDAERATLADAAAAYVRANPGTAGDKVDEVVQAIHANASGHLYPAGGRDAFASALAAKPMSELQDMFGDLQTQVMERVFDAGAMETPLVRASLEGMRMINEAAVAVSHGDLTLLKLVVDDASSMWGDESIMDGTARATLAKAAPSSDWQAVAKAALESELSGPWASQYDPIATSAPVPVTDAVVEELALAVSQTAMGYGGTGDIPFRMHQIGELVDELGLRADLALVKAETKDGDPGTRKRDALMYTLLNKTSGEHINLYIYENSL